MISSQGQEIDLAKPAAQGGNDDTSELHRDLLKPRIQLQGKEKKQTHMSRPCEGGIKGYQGAKKGGGRFHLQRENRQERTEQDSPTKNIRRH